MSGACAEICLSICGGVCAAFCDGLIWTWTSSTKSLCGCENCCGTCCHNACACGWDTDPANLPKPETAQQQQAKAAANEQRISADVPPPKYSPPSQPMQIPSEPQSEATNGAVQSTVTIPEPAHTTET